MITKYNQFIKEAFEDVYPDTGFKLLATEDEEYVVYSNNSMALAFLIPTENVSSIIEAGDIGMLYIYEKSHTYTLRKLEEGRVYHTDLEWDDIKNLNPNRYSNFGDSLERHDRWTKDPESTNTQQDPTEYIQTHADGFEDEFGVHINSFTKVDVDEYKYKVVEFQKGIMRKQKLNFG